MTAWFRATDAGVLISVHVQPGARRTEIVGLHGEALKIRLQAPPVDGKANAALVDFLADRLGVSRSHVEIRSGHSSRHKQLFAAGISAAAVAALV